MLKKNYECLLVFLSLPSLDLFLGDLLISGTKFPPCQPRFLNTRQKVCLDKRNAYHLILLQNDFILLFPIVTTRSPRCSRRWSPVPRTLPTQAASLSSTSTSPPNILLFHQRFDQIWLFFLTLYICHWCVYRFRSEQLGMGLCALTQTSIIAERWQLKNFGN